MSIGGFAARMKDGLDKTHKFRKYLDIILQETSRLEKLVQDVKELSEMQTVYLQSANMNNLLSDVVKDFSPIMSGESIDLVADIEDSLPTINIDREQISRALKNIIQNSIEALPTGGTIELKARAVDSHIRIVVDDSGIGIDEDKFDSILDPFVTSKTTGAGLGLTMVYQIVKNHQGEIDIKRKDDKGTVVKGEIDIKRKDDKGTVVTLDIPVYLKPEMEG